MTSCFRAHLAMPRIVLTGGPGAGKTTLLRGLSSRGYAVVDDTARTIIQNRSSRSLPPRPRPLEFAEEILRRDIEKYREHASASGYVFFERGILDALCMLDQVRPLQPAELQSLVSAYPYHPQVFLLPPWEAIYTNDSERDQTFADAVHVHEMCAGWYRQCGYEVIEVPKTTVAARCTYVLRALGREAS